MNKKMVEDISGIIFNKNNETVKNKTDKIASKKSEN